MKSIKKFMSLESISHKKAFKKELQDNKRLEEYKAGLL